MEVENGSLQNDSFRNNWAIFHFHDYGRKDAIRISLVSVVWLFLGMFETSFHINSYVHGSTTLHN